MADVLTQVDNVNIARLILLKTIQRRLGREDAQAATDVKAALDEVDPSDWVSCLRWAVVLTNQADSERRVMP